MSLIESSETTHHHWLQFCHATTNKNAKSRVWTEAIRPKPKFGNQFHDYLKPECAKKNNLNFPQNHSKFVTSVVDRRVIAQRTVFLVPTQGWVENVESYDFFKRVDILAFLWKNQSRPSHSQSRAQPQRFRPTQLTCKWKFQLIFGHHRHSLKKKW